MSIKIAFLTSFSHEVHFAFAEAIDADVFHFRATYSGPGQWTPIGDAIAAVRWPEYDVFVIEGSAPLYAAATRAAIDDATIVYLGADRGMYALSPASGRIQRDTVIDSVLERFGLPAVRAVAQRTIDGAIVVSDFIADYTRAIVGSNTPIRVVHPFIQRDTYDALMNVEPNLRSPVAVTIGRPNESKGIKRLIRIWQSVRKKHECAKLHVVGPGNYPAKYEKTPGVTFWGYVEGPSDIFERASLFVQPSEGDAFAISTVEAMSAGVPALVTMTTGARSEVRAVSGELVVDSSENALTEGIVDYFDRELADRRELSRRARERGKRFTPESQLDAFKKAFESLLRDIELRR